MKEKNIYINLNMLKKYKSLRNIFDFQYEFKNYIYYKKIISNFI